MTFLLALCDGSLDNQKSRVQLQLGCNVIAFLGKVIIVLLLRSFNISLSCFAKLRQGKQ